MQILLISIFIISIIILGQLISKQDKKEHIGKIITQCPICKEIIIVYLQMQRDYIKYKTPNFKPVLCEKCRILVFPNNNDLDKFLDEYYEKYPKLKR